MRVLAAKRVPQSMASLKRGLDYTVLRGGPTPLSPHPHCFLCLARLLDAPDQSLHVLSRPRAFFGSFLCLRESLSTATQLPPKAKLRAQPSPTKQQHVDVITRRRRMINLTRFVWQPESTNKLRVKSKPN